MKRHLLALTISLFLFYLCYSQNTGIGITTPQSKLHIYRGASGYVGAYPHQDLIIEGSDHTWIQMLVPDNKEMGLLLGKPSHIASGGIVYDINNNMHFRTNGNINRMIINADGNVGIGTVDPDFILDVMGRSRFKTGILGNIFTSPGFWFDDYRDGNNRIFLGMQDSIRLGIWGEGTPGAGWSFNFNARDGKVGVGRLASGYQLELANEYGLGLYKNSGNSFYGALNSNADSALVISSAFGSIFGGPPAKDILLNPPPGFLLYSGRVGVGELSPTAKFHVNGNVMIGSGDPASGYSLSVNGKIICTEAKVQLNASWPDYVFKKGYSLLSLDDLEKYIRETNHLPGIPAATEIEKNGVELGDMIRRLTEITEQLTLYIIQLKKENDRLSRQLNENINNK
jgi:hypothetical protein